MPDIIGLGKAIEKAIDALSSVTSTLYRPYKLKKMTKKTIESLEQLGVNIEEVKMDITIEDGILSVEVHKQIQQLPDNMQFLIGQEMKKQENIQNIIENTILQLAVLDDSEVNDEAVNESWMLRFLESSSYSTEEEVQNMWSKILADEVKKPGTYSLRTIKVLETMTKKDADLFIKICNVAYHNVSDGSHFVPSTQKTLTMHGLSVLDIVELEEMGFLVQGLHLNISNNSTAIAYDNTVFGMKNLKRDKQINVYKFTCVAEEMLALITISKIFPSDQALKEFFHLNTGETINLHIIQNSQRYIITPYKTII